MVDMEWYGEQCRVDTGLRGVLECEEQVYSYCGGKQVSG